MWHFVGHANNLVMPAQRSESHEKLEMGLGREVTRLNPAELSGLYSVDDKHIHSLGLSV